MIVSHHNKSSKHPSPPSFSINPSHLCTNLMTSSFLGLHVFLKLVAKKIQQLAAATSFPTFGHMSR